MTITPDGQNTVEKCRKYPESHKRGLMSPGNPDKVVTRVAGRELSRSLTDTPTSPK